MSTQPDPFGLSRFLDAQASSYDQALAELHAGRKRSHWIWYVFPQIAGLGRSTMSDHYGLSGLSEATAYLAHPVLGNRLREAVRAMLAHTCMSATDVLGELDAMKFRSSLTLFQLVAPTETLFSEALKWFFAGQPDPRTLQVIGSQDGA